MSFGDDLQTIVADLGTAITKIGYAGNDAPHAIMPTLAGIVPAAAAAMQMQGSRHYGRSGTHYSFDLQPPKQNLSLKNPLPEGLVSDWDAVTAMLDYALVERCAMPTRASVAAAAVAAAAAAASSSKGAGGAASAAANKASSSSSSSSLPSSSSSSSSSSNSTSLTSASSQAARALESNRVEASLRNNPFILSEHVHASKADREKWCELLFERYDAPGIFLSKGGIFSLYANARTTGVTVDFGAGGTTITPVQDGYPLMMGVRIHPLGGNALTEEFGKALQEKFAKTSSSSSSSSSSSIFRGLWNLPPSPPALLSVNLAEASSSTSSTSSGSSSSNSASSSWHPSVLQWNLSEQSRQMKHDLCRVHDVPLAELGSGNGGSGTTAALPSSERYTLPDGREIVVSGTERMAIPELLFDPFYYGSSAASGVGGGAGGGAAGNEDAGNGGLNKVREARGEAPIPGASVSVPQVLLASAMACDPDIRRDLIGNLVLTGGASTMRGLQERLVAEFAPLAPVGTKAKWAAANDKERPLGAWLGGSILGSLGGFGEMWLSRSEYQEHGVKAVHLKCV